MERGRGREKGEGGRSARRTDVGLVVRAVEVYTVPACGEGDIGADAALADIFGEGLGVELVVLARRTSVAAKVGAGVAAVAVLALLGGVDGAAGRVTNEHAETLGTEVSVVFLVSRCSR